MRDAGKQWHQDQRDRHDAKDEHERSTNDRTVVLVGGNGGMSDRYREVTEARGLSLRHFEKRVPNGVRRTLGNVVAVVIVVGMVSHALRDQIRNLVPGDAKIVYVRTASVSALRQAVDEVTTPTAPIPGSSPAGRAGRGKGA